MIWIFVFIIIVFASLSIASIVIAVNSSSKVINNNTSSSSSSTGSANSISSRIIVNNSNVTKTMGGVIDSTKQYLIDGVVDLGANTITVPPGGINITGLGLDISKLVSSIDNYTMLESPLSGSGNVFLEELTFEVLGASSKVFQLQDATGFHAVEMNIVNFDNCTSLGSLADYRQGLETGTGRFGGAPSLEFIGQWIGGYRMTTSIVRVLSNLMTEPLFKAGENFTMASRFLTDVNCDLPSSAALTDFAPENFIHPSLLQFFDTIITRDGILNPEDANLTPNINETHLESYWKSNQGLHNTYIGGRITIDADDDTTILAINTFYTLNATTWTATDLEHFSTPSPNQLQLEGDQPIMYNVIVNMAIDGTANDTLQLRLTKKVNGGAFEEQFTEERIVNNLAQGGRDIAFFTMTVNVTMHQGDYVFLEIANETGANDVTAEVGGYLLVEER